MNANSIDEQPKHNGHYRHGELEVIDIIKLALTDEQYEGFLLGNMLKYILRADFKGQHNSDMTKAIDYAMMKMVADTDFRDKILTEIKEEIQWIM